MVLVIFAVLNHLRISEILQVVDGKDNTKHFYSEFHVLLLDDVLHGTLTKLNWDLLLGLGFGTLVTTTTQ